MLRADILLPGESRLCKSERFICRWEGAVCPGRTVEVSLFAPDAAGRNVMAWVQLLLLVLVTIALPGCEVVGGIFKAGAWVGALAVILVIAIVGILAAKIRG